MSKECKERLRPWVLCVIHAYLLGMQCALGFVSQPIVPEPIPVRFPYPPFATNPDEAGRDLDKEREKTQEVGRRMGAMAGPEPRL